MRILWSDYGADPMRLANTEIMLKRLAAAGHTVYRTSLNPLSTVAVNLPLPKLVLTPKVLPWVGPDKIDKSDADRARIMDYCASLRQGDKAELPFSVHQQFAHLFYEYIIPELKSIRPELVVLWHQFNAFHYVIEDWCRKNGVEIVYGENGVLPGSWCFEYGGQMAESWIAQHPKAFKALPIVQDDIDRARAYLEHCRTTGLNRKGQGQQLSGTALADWLAADDRPTILYAGINDSKTGVFPFKRDRSLKHVQEFITSEHGLEAIVNLARAKNWRVIFKPHPSVNVPVGHGLDDGRHLAIADRDIGLVDLIKQVDVVTTIVSQSSYMSLIHGKPCVLMGRMQLSGSGLVEEALFSQQLHRAVSKCLQQGFTDSMEQAFERHVARLLRYYVVSPSENAEGHFMHGLTDVGDELARKKVGEPGEFSVVGHRGELVA
uniref:capsular polysaccharide export protein, LipB/KpsS family n=1 Tax=Roseovarius indicus TaxID=540747 RepID=UPI003B52B7AB